LIAKKEYPERTNLKSEVGAIHELPLPQISENNKYPCRVGTAHQLGFRYSPIYYFQKSLDLVRLGFILQPNPY
jgi:hypothetical protein